MEVTNRLAPEECSSLEDIRREIDYLDRAVIALLGKRFKYVLAAAKFKLSGTPVRDSERENAMLLQRRVWAEAEGLSPDVVKKMYDDLIDYFVKEEEKQRKAQSI